MTISTTEPHRIKASDAAQIQKWFEERGGIAIWHSINLSNPDGGWTTPATTSLGQPAEKPTWEAARTPARIITDPAEVLVEEPVLVKRFHVAVRRGSGLTVQVTDAGSRRIRREVDKAGAHAWYEFDYSTQDALIFKPGAVVPLSEWELPVRTERT